MKKSLFIITCLLWSVVAGAQEFATSKAKFHWGDNAEWKNPGFNDSQWQEIPVDKNWEEQGFNREKTYAWYRVHFTPTASWFANADQKRDVVVVVGYVDDADETFLNGEQIGGCGRLPDNPNGYESAWSTMRAYTIDANKLKMNEDNVIAVRMWNEGSEGGISDGEREPNSTPVYVYVPSRLEYISLSAQQVDVKGRKMVAVKVGNSFHETQKGVVEVKLIDRETNASETLLKHNVTLGKDKPKELFVPFYDKLCRYAVTYTDTRLNKNAKCSYSPKYILTPKAPESPRFNMAGLFGVRPGSPVIYRLPVSGVRPMKFSISNLPEGLTLDETNGVISGKLAVRGDYVLKVTAENAKGKAEADLTIRVGNTIALTPPMGWNSWNCWGLSVSQERVMSSAKALIEKGLADYGYAYMNVDDAWEAAERNADGTIATNEKFPDMKALGDWLHANGLKFGIYSSPGDRTCGGYLGSIDHELQDAETYNYWGVDYLKYDWCGYSRKHDTELDNKTVASYVRPYLLMERYLRQQPRDIFYSLCQYGMQDVWKWGYAVDANSWRTTGDITDTWESLHRIGFEQQLDLFPYAQPGHWNDPDMLIVGKVGWSDKLRDSRLSPDEQYTHISLWCLLAANMLIGCDLAQLDDFTINLLCNNEVNAINQDILGKQAQRMLDENGIQVWVRPLSDGSHAVGIFNLNDDDATVDISKYLRKVGLSGNTVRDLWRQKDIPTTEYVIPVHGVRLLKVAR